MYKCSNCGRTDEEQKRICPRCHMENSYNKTIESLHLSLEDIFDEEEEECEEYDDEDLEV